MLEFLTIVFQCRIIPFQLSLFFPFYVFPFPSGPWSSNFVRQPTRMLYLLLPFLQRLALILSCDSPKSH